METKRINDKIIFRLDKGEEIIESITKICEDNNIKCGSITGVGATNKVKVGLFNTITKEYHSDELTGDFEIAPLSGNISRMNKKVYLHIHINLSDEKHNSFGGHLNYAVVSATFEGIIEIIDCDVSRIFDEEIGLNLLKF